MNCRSTNLDPLLVSKTVTNSPDVSAGSKMDQQPPLQVRHLYSLPKVLSAFDLIRTESKILASQPSAMYHGFLRFLFMNTTMLLMIGMIRVHNCFRCRKRQKQKEWNRNLSQGQRRADAVIGTCEAV